MDKIVLATVNVKKHLYGVTAGGLAAIAPNISMGQLDAYVSAQGIPVVLIDSEAEGCDIEGLIDRIKAEKPLWKIFNHRMEEFSKITRF